MFKSVVNFSKTSHLRTHFRFLHEQAYPEHIVTTPLQKFMLAVGSSAIALVDPFRHDMVAVSAETLYPSNLANLRQRMMADEEGSLILRETPRINSNTVDLKKLESYPQNSLGYHYIKFLHDNNITCDTRRDVRFIDDPDLAYVMQRYREIHDLVHLILGMPTHMLGEVTVKWVEAIQFQIPMCWGAAVFGAYRLRPKQRHKYLNGYLDWAIECGKQSKFLLGVYYEKRWEQDIDELRKELKIVQLPSRSF